MTAIMTLAVIGAGTMGHGIAYVAAAAGYTVRLHDANADALSRAAGRIAAAYEKAIQRGKSSSAERDAGLARLSTPRTFRDAVLGADLVIEAVPERMEIKQALFSEAESILGDSVILASNTSSLSIASIADGLKRPERVIGMHFFNPVPVMKLVELIRSPSTDARIVYAARSSITDEQLGDLLVGLTTRRAVAPAPALVRAQTAAEARRSQLAFAGARKLAAATDLAAAEDIATETLRELLDIDRAYCVFVDPDTGALWSETRRRAGGDDRRAIAGIAGWTARTGRAVSVARASADPRWLGPIDDPDGDPNSQLLLQPMIRADGRVHGILVAVRRPRRPGFTDTDTILLARFAALAAPLFEQVAVHVETQALIGDDAALRSAFPAAPEPTWLTIVSGQHPLSRWVFLALGAVLGLLLGLLV